MKQMKQMTRIRMTASFLLLWLTSFLPLTAFADMEEGLLIGAVNYPDRIYANQAVPFTIQVLQIENQTQKKATDAKVTLFMSNGETTFSQEAVFAREGEFTSEVSFPKVGPWKLVVTAVEPGSSPVPAKEEGGSQQVLDFTLNVEAPGTEAPASETPAAAADAGSDPTYMIVLTLLMAVASVLLILRIRKIKK